MVNVPELESVLDCGCFLSMSRVPVRQSIAIYKADVVLNQSQQLNGAFLSLA